MKRIRTDITFFNSMGRGHGEIRYRDLAEQLGDALFIASPRSGLFVYVNHKALELTGFTRDELGSKGLSELFSPREAAEALDSIRELEPGATRHLQNVPLKAHNGKVAFADLRVTAPLDADEPVVIILARDAAERILSEQSAGRRRDSLVAIADLLSLFASRKRDSLDEVLQLCHRALLADCVAFYRPPSINSGNMALVHAIQVPEDFPVALGQADSVLADLPLIWHAGERPASALSRAARSAGLSTLHVRQVGDGQAATSGVFVAGYRPANNQLSRSPEVAALINITTEWLGAYLANQRQSETSTRAENSLATTGRELEAMLAETNEGVLRVDCEGCLAEMNPAAESLLGFRAADTLHAPLEDVLVSAQLLAKPLLDAIKQGLRWGGVETDLVRRDGSSVSVFLRALPLTDAQNKFDGGLVLFTDRTDQKQFQAQSDHLERRAWLGDLSAIFAHDVRNPLNGISAGLSYLATKFSAADPLADAVNKMQAEVLRVDQLLKNVLLVAKPAELHYEPVQLV
ncbi:MAG: PAS domain-containing protein, partial [Chloroflexota bacterium]